MVWWQLLQSKCLIWHGEKQPACLSLALPHHGSRGSICTGIAVGSTWTRGTCAQDAMCPKQPLPWRIWQPCVRRSAETHIGTARLFSAFPKYHTTSKQSKICGYWHWDSLHMATTLQKIQWSVRLFPNKCVLSKKERGRSWKHSFVPLGFE